MNRWIDPITVRPPEPDILGHRSPMLQLLCDSCLSKRTAMRVNYFVDLTRLLPCGHRNSDRAGALTIVVGKGTDPVAAQCLRLVDGTVGRGEQVRCGPAMTGEKRDPDADAGRWALAISALAEDRLDPTADPLRHRHRFGAGRLRHQDGELVAPQPHAHIA